MKKFVFCLALIFFLVITLPLSEGKDEEKKNGKGETEKPAPTKAVEDRSSTDEMLIRRAKEKKKSAAQLSQDLDLLEDIKNQRLELVQKKKELDLKQNQIDALVVELNERIKYLENLRNEIKGLLEQKDVQEEKNLSKLVKMYEETTPDKAAKLIGKLEPYIAISILAKMKPRTSAQILNLIDATTAYLISSNFYKLWKENYLDQKKIDAIIKMVEAAEPDKAAKMINNMDVSKIVYILTKVKKKQLDGIINNLAEQKRELIIREYRDNVAYDESASAEDKKLVDIYNKILATQVFKKLSDRRSESTDGSDNK